WHRVAVARQLRARGTPGATARARHVCRGELRIAGTGPDAATLHASPRCNGVRRAGSAGGRQGVSAVEGARGLMTRTTVALMAALLVQAACAGNDAPSSSSSAAGSPTAVSAAAESAAAGG